MQKLTKGTKLFDEMTKLVDEVASVVPVPGH